MGSSSDGQSSSSSSSSSSSESSDVDVGSLQADTRRALEERWGKVVAPEIVTEATMIRRVLLSCGGERAGTRIKVVELYSPPRVTEKRRRMEFNLGGLCLSTY